MTAISHGDGRFRPTDLGFLGEGAVIEEGVLIFNPAHVYIGCGVYIGHRTMLCGDTRGNLRLDDGTWVGPDCYMHAAGGIHVGQRTGIGPRVTMLTSVHTETAPPAPIIDAPLTFAPIEVEPGCDIGVGTIVLPGSHIGAGVQIGAGSVVVGEIPSGAIAAGAPARVMRQRGLRGD